MKNSISSPISRRDFLRLLALAGGGWLAACSRIPSTSTGTPYLPRATVKFTPQPTNLAAQVTPEPTQVLPKDIRSKIDSVIILLQENHSFDSLFAGYPGANGKAADRICPDALKHTIRQTGLPGEYVCSYTEAQIINYWKLASRFALCDNYFSEVLCPSFPNYLMMTSAQTPISTDPSAPFECPHYCFDIPSIANFLDEKGITWHDYGGMFANIKSLEGRPEISYRKLDGFFDTTAAGQLPNVTWIGAFLVGGVNESGHPPANICVAENFAVSVINAVMAGPQWPKTLLILTWDEWGGFYDHVKPPVVERYSNGKPFRYGYRVPCIIISPYSRAGSISHIEFSHISTLRTIEDIFSLPSLNERDKKANSLLNCLDFTQTPIEPFSLQERTCT